MGAIPITIHAELDQGLCSLLTCVLASRPCYQSMPVLFSFFLSSYFLFCFEIRYYLEAQVCLEFTMHLRLASNSPCNSPYLVSQVLEF